MEDTEFKIKIIDFYKDVDKPIINNIYEDNFGKNILEFTALNQVPILKKEKTNWKVKDKKKILKDLENVQKRKIKIFKDSFNGFDELNINQIKEKNTKLLSEIETITDIKKKIDNDENYLRLKNLAALGSTKIDQKGGKSKKNLTNIKIVDINEETKTKIKINTSFINSSESDDFIEIFSN